jgi:EAL domain-containing protein (putative c-di-GMP-specific phosphodiesterase class I)
MLHFQPVVAVNDSDHARYEVLLRMMDKELGLVMPGVFIPAAERLGLATEIDYWVIKNSMKMLQEQNRKNNYIQLFVNLSGQLFSDPEFVNRIINTLDDFDVDASQIIFELTERAAVGNINIACQKMEKLKEAGFKFAIDDFGSGFSSFVYLKNMPVDIVKIEGEFVERLTSDEVDRAMVKSMIDIAKACGKEVVAEFVCDCETLEILQEYGVDYVQGYFIAEPKPELVHTTLDSLLLENSSLLISQSPKSA